MDAVETAFELSAEQQTAVQAFLLTMSANARRRGQKYFHRGAVRSVEAVEAGTQYLAEVIGTELYQVTLSWMDDIEWISDCTCPVGVDCKHAVAAMLELSHNGLKLRPAGAGSSDRLTDQAGRATSTPRAGIEPALRAALGRKLTGPERAYAGEINRLYLLDQSTGAVTHWHLSKIAPKVNGYSWEPVPAWPGPVDGVVEWWQYLAFWLREQGVSIPGFMEPIGADDRVGRTMRTWRRQKEISRSRDELERLAPYRAPVTRPPLELRARVAPAGLVLEWKPAGKPDYTRMTATEYRAQADAHAQGRVEVRPEVYPLWQAFTRHIPGTRKPEWDWADEAARRMLHVWLGIPALAERIVGDNGRPLERMTEPWRWQLDCAATADDDYRLRLVEATGKLASSIVAVLPGDPTLYLTGSAVYPGPPPLNESKHLHKLNVPAPSLESVQGASFLARLGVDLPPRLAERVRRIPMQVEVQCALRVTGRGRQRPRELVQIAVRAVSGDDAREELFGPRGWVVPGASPSRTNSYPDEYDDYDEYDEWDDPEVDEKTADGAEDEAAENQPIPLYDRGMLIEAGAAIDAGPMRWDSDARCWSWRITKGFAAEFVEWLASLPAAVTVLLDDELASLRREPVRGSVRFDCEPSGVDWFDLKVVLDVSDTDLTDAELKALLDARGGYVRLGVKGWRRLDIELSDEDDEQLSRLGLGIQELSGDAQRMHVLQLADDAAARFLSPDRAESFQRRAREIKVEVAPPVPDTVRGTLRPYQVDGYHFLAYLASNRFGGVLADDMGLGKTLQALAWLCWLRQTQSNVADSPSLVVCPKSVTDNWQAEAARFVPGLRVNIWRGVDGAGLVEQIERGDADLWVINYVQLRFMADELAEINWLAAILDEGQAIKNPQSLTTRAARGLDAAHRLVLTGTPIENRLLDLWSLMSFAMPGLLGKHAAFKRRYDKGDDPLARRRLAARVRPFLLRRTKGQVAEELPDRIEEDLLCEMDTAQRTLYRAEFKAAQQMLLKIKTRQEFDRQRFNFLTCLLRLRQICCHPALIDPKKKQASAKLEALVDLLEPVMAEGHKVLVFSQFVGLLELVRPVIERQGWKQYLLTGDTENRGSLVASFQADPDPAVFLMSLKAGGFGLNLTAASYVVLFDPWWNPAVENQAIDRTHRIGQTSHVMAYRLLIKDSIEEKIRALQRTKTALAEDVLGEERFSRSLTLEDVRFLFRDGSAS